jgi:hypothetical protein
MDLWKLLLPKKPTLRNWRNADRFKPNVTPPRQKFAGFVEFEFNPSVVSSVSDSSAFRTQISSLVQTAKIPQIQFQTQAKKSYNHRRLFQTGVDFGPCDITVIDTVNNEWLTLFMKYFSYYYNEPRNRTTEGNGNLRDLNPKQWPSHSDSLTKSSSFTSSSFSSNTAGLDARADMHFINQIKIVTYAGGKGVEYILFRPQITSFDPGEIDYTSSDFRTFELTFEIENMTVNNKVNFDMTPTDLARFDNSDAEFFFDNADRGNKDKVVRPQSLSDFLGSPDKEETREIQPSAKGQA